MNTEDAFEMGKEAGIWKAGAIAGVLVLVGIRSFTAWQIAMLLCYCVFSWRKYSQIVERFKKLNSSP